MFALPGALGFGSAFAQISAHVTDRSCYAIETRGLLSAPDKQPALDALIEDCAQTIAEAAGGRAVHLVGHSFGVELLGRVATASARINQRFLPKPELDFLIALSGQLGAAGVQIAHSGTVVGLIFDARLPELTSRIGRCIDALDREGIPPGESFAVRA